MALRGLGSEMPGIPRGEVTQGWDLWIAFGIEVPAGDGVVSRSSWRESCQQVDGNA